MAPIRLSSTASLDAVLVIGLSVISESRAPPIVILGAGLTGLSTAHHLRVPYVLVEREGRVGGKATSHRREGYTFDVTGHWLHLRDPRTRALVQRLFAPGDLVEIVRETAVFSHGAMLDYPFQANLHGLPLAVVRECLVGFVQAQARAAAGGPAPRTFEDFAVARFGRGIARHFFVPYNEKLLGMHPNRLTADWASSYVPVPDVEQVVGGAIGLRQRGLGYNATFLYPAAGGIDALPQALLASVPADGRVLLGTDVDEIDPAGHRVKLAGRPDWQGYRRLVSTIPLPELIARIPSAPASVREAAALLRWVRWRYVDLATRRPAPIPHHWVYVPEPRLPFFRVGVFSNAVAAMAPSGCSSLYVELADRQRDPDMRDVVAGLVELGALASGEDVVFHEVREVEHAYVVFDDARESATSTILRWLESVDVRSCGRYGAWVYNAMEDCMLEGMLAATWAEAS